MSLFEVRLIFCSWCFGSQGISLRSSSCWETQGEGGAVSREEGIFMGERKSTTSKLSPMKIPCSRLTAPLCLPGRRDPTKIGNINRRRVGIEPTTDCDLIAAATMYKFYVPLSSFWNIFRSVLLFVRKTELFGTLLRVCDESSYRRKLWTQCDEIILPCFMYAEFSQWVPKGGRFYRKVPETLYWNLTICIETCN